MLSVRLCGRKAVRHTCGSQGVVCMLERDANKAGIGNVHSCLPLTLQTFRGLSNCVLILQIPVGQTFVYD